MSPSIRREVCYVRFARHFGRFLAVPVLAAGMSHAQTLDTNSVAAAMSNAVPRLPVVTVTAQKEPAPAQDLPVSLTAVTQQDLADADVQTVKGASIAAPNTMLTEFSARKLSAPRFRGIGAGPDNPGITTYIDGVPQLNGNSSSIELTDVQQIEFVRGPQAALYGRNTAGGLINIVSRTPSNIWQGEAEGDYGNYNFGYANARVSGPLVNDEVALSLAGGFSGRDGYTINTYNGSDVDSRDALFGKLQLLLNASERFDVRLLLSGERDRDGDYALGDLAGTRQHPFEVAHDYTGYTHRDLLAPTLLANYHGEALEVASISGGVWWRTIDSTDLDYTPLPLLTRDNQEQQSQFTQEFRLSSPRERPVNLGDQMTLGWQSGVFLFARDYSQDAANNLLPAITGFPLTIQDRSDADIQNLGVGLYGQGTVTLWEKLDATVGLRYDYENADADLRSYTQPPVSFPVDRQLSDDFNGVSPQFGLAWHFTPAVMGYGTISRGYKAGGFNAISPPGDELYGPEWTWNYEIGAKTEWLEGRLQLNAAMFYIDWQDLQLNTPVLTSPGRFYVANAGAADSKGAEVQLSYRPLAGWDLFGSAGYADAEFLSGSKSDGVDVSGNRIPYTPRFTGNAGTQYFLPVNRSLTAYARAEVTVYGDFEFDASNREGQATYSLADFRAGVRGAHWFAEGWVRNAFNTEYIAVALPYSAAFAPSGYVAEPGAPVTYGIRAGLAF